MSEGSSKRLSPAEWAEITTLYERGEASHQELADKYGVSRQAISEGLKKRGVVMGSRLDEVVNEADEAAARARKQRIEEITSMQRKYVKYNDALAQMTMKRIIDAEKSGDPAELIAIHAQLQTLKTASVIIQRTREENYALYDVDNIDTDSEDLPDLAVSVYSDEEMAQIREANEEAYLEHSSGDDDDAEVT